MKKTINDKYFEVKNFKKFSHNNTKLINPACYQNSRLVLTNTSNNFNKENPFLFNNINPNTTKASPIFEKNYSLESEYEMTKYKSMSNIHKRTFNSLNFFSKNQENKTNYKPNDIKHYNSDSITLYNKTNKFRFTNLTNKDSLNLNHINRKNDFISTKNSNLISTNYQSLAFSYNTKGSKFNNSMNSLAENKNYILTNNNKFKLTDSNINNSNSINLKKSKAKNKSISNDINQIIRSIYDYSDISTENSNIFQKNKSLEKIVEESSPKNKKFLMGKNNSKEKIGETKKLDNQPPKIKLSLMEKYLISTDYSMNLNFKMR